MPRALWSRRIPMRDGVELAADVMLPPGDAPWPTVVSRTPYMRGNSLQPDHWLRLVGEGYAFVTVDVRGRGDSEGAFTPFARDGHDGYDVIEWVAAQPWCSGRVGMVGSSYVGLTQWWTARSKPPHLACIVPQAVGAASAGPRPRADTAIPLQYWIWWLHLVTGRTMQNPGAPSWAEHYGQPSVDDLHERVGTARRWWPSYLDGEIDYLGPDQVLSAEDWAQFDVPAMVGVGWWDDQSTMTTWEALRDSPAGARSQLVIGAWDHDGNQAPRPVLGGLDVSASGLDVVGYIERFLAIHLKGEPAAGDDVARCRIFRTGAMEWEGLDDWPAPAARPEAWYLGGDGALEQALGAEDGEGTYVYDPHDLPDTFHRFEWLAASDPPLDERHRLRRKDVLVFTSSELDRRVDVSGRAWLEAMVSIDGPDADLFVTLYDVHPDGRSIALAGLLPEGRRLAYRNGTEAEPMALGVPTEVRIPVTWLHHSFLPGHRIRIAVASSAFPFAAPHPDAARVTVHHGPHASSRLLLPTEPTSGWR